MSRSPSSPAPSSWPGGCAPGDARGAPARGRTDSGLPPPGPPPCRCGRRPPTSPSAPACSRVTGLLRFVALAWALGQTTLADSYNLANTTPNMLYDIVLGGILSATFIPVFVDRLSNKSEREAFDSISAVLTVSVVGPPRHHVGGAGGGPVPHRRPHRARYAFGPRPDPPRPARAPGRHRLPALVRDPDRGLRPLRAGGRSAQHAPPLHRRRLGPHRQQRRLHRHADLVRALDLQRRLAGQRGGPPVPARPPRPRHLARGRPAGRGAHPEPAPGRPRAACAGTGTPATTHCAP